MRLAADRPGVLPASHAAEREANAFASNAFARPLVTAPKKVAPLAPPAPHPLVQGLGAGAPLTAHTRREMEQRLGADFSGVRVHEGAQASGTARALGAAAFTSGSHVVMDNAHGGTANRRLLAHELTHVMQQGGHAAVSDVPAGSVQRESVNEALSGATGVPTTLVSASASATLAAGQVLTSDADKTIHTAEETRVEVWVDSRGLSVRFSPAIVITSNEWHGANIWLHRIEFDFARQAFSWEAEARGITWLFGASGRINRGLQGLFAGLPAGMRVPGYNPFADPDLQQNLATFAASLGSGGGGMPRSANVSLSASIVLSQAVRRDVGGVGVAIPEQSRIYIDVNLAGGIPARLSDARVSSARLHITNPRRTGANIEMRILDTDFPVAFVDGISFGAGGRLSFDYTLATEVVEGAVRQLLVAAAVAAGEGHRVGEGALDYRQPALHAVIDARLRRELEPLLRELVLRNRHAVPGIDLGEVLGFGPALGDFPENTPPAGPGTAAG